MFEKCGGGYFHAKMSRLRNGIKLVKSGVKCDVLKQQIAINFWGSPFSKVSALRASQKWKETDANLSEMFCLKYY